MQNHRITPPVGNQSPSDANHGTKQVLIPACPEHEGILAVTVTLNWTCPVCGSRRGAIYQTRSYDGSRALDCSGWSNPCGHIDKYSDVLNEAATNGLNGQEVQP